MRTTKPIAIQHRGRSDLASRIARGRKKLGLSQEGLAEKAKVKPSVVRRYEQREVANPSALKIAAIAAALGVSVESLLRNEAA